MVYGRPGKCLDCNPTVLPRWVLRHRLFATGEQARNGFLNALERDAAQACPDGNDCLDGNMLAKVFRDRLIRAVTRPPFRDELGRKGRFERNRRRR
jgi:hypothetical protein